MSALSRRHLVGISLQDFAQQLLVSAAARPVAACVHGCLHVPRPFQRLRTGSKTLNFLWITISPHACLPRAGTLSYRCHFLPSVGQEWDKNEFSAPSGNQSQLPSPT